VVAADVAVLGVPFDGGATFRRGARFGPAAIREASILLRPYNEPLGLAPFEAAQVVDAGDAAPNPIDSDAAHGAIERRASELHARAARVLAAGRLVGQQTDGHRGVGVGVAILDDRVRPAQPVRDLRIGEQLVEQTAEARAGGPR